MANLVLGLGLITAWWALMVVYWVGLPFASLMLIIGWSRLVNWRIALFERFGPSYQWVATVTCLYFPALVALGVYTVKSFNEERVYAPIFGLMALNSVPTWWIVGIAGFIFIGVRVTKVSNRLVVPFLFAVCGVCYVAPLFVLLTEPAFSTIPVASTGALNWMLYLNVFIAIALLIVVEWPIKIKSWRRIILLLLLVLAVAFASSFVTSMLATSHISNSD